jgi:hypothetical protein
MEAAIMTEPEWLACGDPPSLLNSRFGRASERKMRLFGCACCRQVWDLLAEECFRRAVEVAERFADGGADKRELIAARKASGAALERSGLGGVVGRPYCALGSAWSTTRQSAMTAAIYPLWVFTMGADRLWQLSLLRCIFGNPFRPASIDSARLSPTVVALAQTMYEERAFDRMPELADALEAAGCHEANILGHCRQAGPHVRGCWVVDVILGKS